MKEENKSLIKAKRSYSKEIDLSRLNRTISWKLDMAAKQKKLAKALIKDRLELKACPICKCKDFALFVEISHYPYCECANCGHIFSQKPPRPEAIKGLYAANEDKKSGQSKICTVKELFSVRIETIAAPKVQYITERVPSKGKWVDIGCGVGEVLVAAKAKGWQVLGIESDHEKIKFAKMMGVDIINTFITQENISEYIKDATVISLFNLLEHILYPDKLLKAVVNAVPSNTHIVIDVPRHPSLSALANCSFPDMISRHIYPPDHLHIFTEKSIGLLLKKNGLIAESIWLFGQDFYEVVSSMAAKNGSEKKDFLEKALKNANQIQAAIDKSGLSDTMIIISRKL